MINKYINNNVLWDILMLEGLAYPLLNSGVSGMLDQESVDQPTV